MNHDFVWFGLGAAIFWVLLLIYDKLKAILESLEQQRFDRELEDSDLMRSPPITSRD